MSAAAAAHSGSAVAHRGAITLAVMLASVMQALDNTIANVALPHIQGSLSATQDQMAWVLTSYIVAAAIMTPLSGWLAGRFGRKRVFLVSIVVFTAASALCGVAQSLTEIVLARLLQGLGGAALIPMSQAVLLDINPPERHARAMTLWVAGVVIGPILGPALGGWLTESYNWRWVFYINVPLGVLSFLGILTFMRETERRNGSFDFLGFAALSVAVGAVQLLLDRGQIKDWFNSTEIWVEATIAGLALYVFVVHVLTTRKQPFVSLVLFKDRNFVAGNVFIFVVGVVLFATLALLPPMLQQLMGYPVFITGLVTAPRGIGTLTAMMLLHRLPARVDPRLLIGAGLVITALSLQSMTRFDLQMGSSLVVWSGFMQGIGTGLVFVPLATTAFATLQPALRNEGTALFSLTRNIGSSIGISVVESLLTRNTQVVHARLAEHVTIFGDAAHGQFAPALTGAGSLAALNRGVTAQAAMIAYDNDFKLMVVLTVCVLPLLLLLRAGRSPAPDESMVPE